MSRKSTSSRRKVFADEEAIETVGWHQSFTYRRNRRKVFADEEAIETSRLRRRPDRRTIVGRYSLTKKRLEALRAALAFGKVPPPRFHPLEREPRVCRVGRDLP